MHERKDKHTPEQRSYNMSRIRSTNTQLEQAFFKHLKDANIPFVAHPKIHGKPDCFIEPNIVIFVDSDFWHGWHFSQWRERMPPEYWVEKIERNMWRDQKKFRSLRRGGFKVMRVWEHSLKKSPAKVIERIQQAL